MLLKMKGLIIKKEPLNKIFNEGKIWEIRGSKCKIRGKINLIESGSGLIKGTCEIIDCIGPLTDKDFLENKNKHLSGNFGSRYKNKYAWVLKNAKEIKPISYKHPKGAIIWVNLTQ